VPADNASIEQENGDVKSVAALQDRIAVNIDHIYGRECGRSGQSAQLGQHLVAQLTVVTMDDCQTRCIRGHVKAGLLMMRAGLHGVGYETHRRGRHLTYCRHLVTVDERREGGRGADARGFVHGGLIGRGVEMGLFLDEH
jgi:hypothetical protein